VQLITYILKHQAAFILPIKAGVDEYALDKKDQLFHSNGNLSSTNAPEFEQLYRTMLRKVNGCRRRAAPLIPWQQMYVCRYMLRSHVMKVTRIANFFQTADICRALNMQVSERGDNDNLALKQLPEWLGHYADRTLGICRLPAECIAGKMFSAVLNSFCSS
jgi:hypothetical protein